MDGTAADAENNFVGLSGELQGGSRRRLLARSRMSKRNFERKLSTYSTRTREGLCANTQTQWDEVLQVIHLSNRYSDLSSVLKQGSALYFIHAHETRYWKRLT